MTTKTKAKKTKAEQLQVPGTERKSDPVIEAAASALRETRSQRMALQQTEAEESDALCAAMQAAGVKVFKFALDDEELTVTLDSKTKVKIRKAATVKSEDE